jgi:hypothetical protein
MPVEAIAEADDLELASLRETLHEKLEGLDSVGHLGARHRGRSIHDEDKGVLALQLLGDVTLFRLLFVVLDLEVLWLWLLKSWHELSHQSDFVIHLLVKEFWLVHILSLIIYMDSFRVIDFVKFLNHHFFVTLLQDHKGFWMADF